MEKRQIVVGLVIKMGKVLLLKKPEQLKWNLPASQVIDDAPEDTILNRIERDTGIDIELKDYLDTLTTETAEVLWYLCSYKGGNIETKGLDAQWVDVESIRDFVSEEAFKVYPEEVLKHLNLELKGHI